MRIDLVGKRFGLLVVIEEIGRAKDKSIIWGCKCDCGSQKLCEVVGGDLRRGRKTDCGCVFKYKLREKKLQRQKQIQDLIGQYFGSLLVIDVEEKVENNAVIYICKCKCKCGNFHYVNSKELIRGGTKSCGCKRSARLIGEKFGRLLVIEKLNEKKNNYNMWKCLCECGNPVNVNTQDLTGGRKKGCGCLEHEYEDLTGTKWERLTVIKLAEHRNNKGELLWECSCSCGSNKPCFISRDKLVKGHTKSCGCLLKEHRGENHSRWNNGITKISKKLRNSITPWKKASLEKYDYRCYITGMKGKDIKVHYSNENYPFYKIVEETFEVLGFEIKPNLGDYTDEQIDLLEKTCLDLHYKHGLGIPLKDELHKEFHAVYGTKGWTQSDFIEFVESKRINL